MALRAPNRTVSSRLLGAAAILLHCSTAALAQHVVYVDASASGANDGGSWANAFTSLQDAIEGAISGDEIWVAAGIYHPDQGRDVTPGDREASFEMKSGVALYGGFRGGETQREERDFEANETILSGDLAGNDNDNVALDEPTRAENSYHVVVAHGGIENVSMLDGFTVTGGHANSTHIVGHHSGAGLRSGANPAIRHVVFRENAAVLGGGMEDVGGTIFGGSGSEGTRLEDVIFQNNVAAEVGGGMYTWRSSTALRSVVFRGNRAGAGAGMYNDRSNVTLVSVRFIANDDGGLFNRQGEQVVFNSSFVGNRSEASGGGLLNDESKTLLANVVFSGNEARTGAGVFSNLNEGSLTAINLTFARNVASEEGGAAHNYAGQPLFANTIFWDNSSPESAQMFNERGSAPVVSHSIIDGSLPPGTIDGGGNLYVDPLFEDALGSDGIAGTEDDDLRLRPDSPAIDAGDNAALPADTLDLDGDGNRSEPLPVDFASRVRVFDGGRSGAFVDIGAHEFGAPAVRVGTQRPAEQPARSNLRLSVYPNPARGAATLVIDAASAARVEITLHDLLGRRIRVLHEGVVSGAGPRVLTVDLGGLAAGAYILRASEGGSANTAVLHVP